MESISTYFQEFCKVYYQEGEKAARLFLEDNSVYDRFFSIIELYNGFEEFLERAKQMSRSKFTIEPFEITEEEARVAAINGRQFRRK